jgi:hypothetical protein
MFNQFQLTSEHSGYWIEEKEARKSFLGKVKDTGQLLDYQGYRWVHRRIARNTDSRTLITTITPKKVFTEVNSTTISVVDTGITNQEMLYLCALSNSFVMDWLLRQKVTTTLNMFYLNQLPIPRLQAGDRFFDDLVSRAARLICTTPQFDDLAREVGLSGHQAGATDLAERAQLRAEIDGMVSHLYDLTEEEFVHILATFPLVAEPVKQAALEAYRKIKPLPTEQIVLGESLQNLVNRIQDEAVREEVTIALNVLPVDAASAVFNVGKALENTTKLYFMELISQRKLFSADGKTVLTTGKIPSQNDMVTALVNNKIIADRKHLDILREERNLGGHNLRTKEERAELQSGSGEIYIRWYLYYIAEFEQRLAALKGSGS